MARQQLTHQVEASGIITSLAHAFRALPGGALMPETPQILGEHPGSRRDESRATCRDSSKWS